LSGIGDVKRRIAGGSDIFYHCVCFCPHVAQTSASDGAFPSWAPQNVGALYWHLHEIISYKCTTHTANSFFESRPRYQSNSSSSSSSLCFSMKERWKTVHCWSRLQLICKYDTEKHHGSMNTTNSFTSAVTHFSQKHSSILSLYTKLLDLQHSRQISTILFRILNWIVMSDGTRDLSLVNVPFIIQWFETGLC
jgi:hypothetical protein